MIRAQDVIIASVRVGTAGQVAVAREGAKGDPVCGCALSNSQPQHTCTGRSNCQAPVQSGKLMNKNVAEAARRVFGNLPYSKGRSGNKALRKNIIGRKIAEVHM